MRGESLKEKYLDEVFGLRDADLSPVRDDLAKHNVAFMSISGPEARILQFLIRGFGVKKIVEVGTLFGFSGLCMAKGLPADGQLITLEKNSRNFEIAQKTFASSSVEKGKISSLCGDALDLLAQIEKEGKGPFDMVFIDANKSGYVEYLNWAEKNVRKGGLIVGDNSFLFGGVWGQPTQSDVGPNQIRVMKEFNLRLADQTRYNSVLIPTSEGMTVAQKLF